MALTLHYHPLASFCHKVLIALYENETPFTGNIVNFADPGSAAVHMERWPVGKIPVLHDSDSDRLIPETTVIIEYLQNHYPGPLRLIPDAAEAQHETRLWDRFFDLYVSVPMQKIVGDRLRPEDAKDPYGVAEAYAALDTAYAMFETQVAGKHLATGDAFTLADCSAFPALFYAGVLRPFEGQYPALSAYFERLLLRPTIARVLREAGPSFQYFPFKDDLPARFRALM
jgi:glutathione S-transferase